MSHTFAISDTFGAVIDKVLMIFRLLRPRPVLKKFFKAWSTVCIAKMLPGRTLLDPAKGLNFVLELMHVFKEFFSNTF
jgi:hypothetical protein